MISIWRLSLVHLTRIEAQAVINKVCTCSGDTPESTAPPSATSTSMSSTSSVSSTSTSLSSSAPTASSASQSSKTATSVIAGCVVGGVVGGTFMAALAFWFYKSGMASKMIAQMSAQTSGQEMLASSGTRLAFQPDLRRPYVSLSFRRLCSFWHLATNVVGSR